MIHRQIASSLIVVGGLVCANVFVNKGEVVVKSKDLLSGAVSNARVQGV
jgi:hypothetical protein